jgi:multicomponent K+:H+ antiporter subunit E
MIPSTRWLPHPLLSAALFVVWLLAANTVAPGHLVLAGLFAIAVPLATSAFWPGRPRLYRPGRLLRLLPVVFYDIAVANVAVARLILGPARRLRPAFVRIPLALEDEFAITLLASIISLTPGTVSSDLSPDRRMLLVHVLDVEDSDALVAHIKARYEAPLKEIFEC